MSDVLNYTPSHLSSTPVIETPVTETVAEQPVKASETKVETKPEVKQETTTTADEYVANRCYTFISSVQVHTEPDPNSLVVGVRSVTDFVVPERILAANGYIWAEYHSSPKHIRYAALASSDGSEKFVE